MCALRLVRLLHQRRRRGRCSIRIRVSCHNDRLKTGNLVLTGIDANDARQHAALLEKVVRKLRGGQMPPAGRAAARRGDARDVHGVARDGARSRGRGGAEPGRVASRRLNRIEYVNVDPGPAGARGRRHAAAAERHGRIRVRQQRRRAVDDAGADGALHRRGDEDQPRGGGQPRQPPDQQMYKLGFESRRTRG